jgi:hypothetical protein
MSRHCALGIALLSGGLLCGAVCAQAIDPVLFVANNVGDNIKSFRVNPDGTLTGIGTFAAGDGPQTISLSPDGRFLAVGHGTASVTTEELRIYEVNPSGSLSLRLTTTVPDSPLDVLWLNNGALAVTKTGSPANVQVYSWNPSGSSLSQIDLEPTGLFNSALSTNGRFLFANDSTGNTIRAFRINANSTLDLVDTQSTSPFLPVSIGLRPDGNYLYGAGGISGDGNRVFGYRVNADGSLDPTVPGDFTSPGESPKNFAFTADGQYAFVGHGTDATIQVFRSDPGTGVLDATGFSYDVGFQGTLGEIAVLGNLLFACDNSTIFDNRTGVVSLRINPNGSLTEVGIFPSDGARPDYLAVWPGIPEPSAAVAMAVVAVPWLARRRHA